MAAREQLILDILANDRASPSLRATGKSASAASDDVAALAKRLDELGAKSAKARVSVEGSAEAQAQLDKLDLKMLQVGRRVMDPKITVEGTAKAAAELAGISAGLDKVGKSAEKAAGTGAGSATGMTALTGSAIPALIGAGVALSPAIITIGTGLAGIGAAAYTAAKNTKLMGPILKPLKQDFAAFSKSLQPEVLGAFGKAGTLLEHVLHDVQPVAAATGKALIGVLGSIDKEFQSGTWQQFFAFMANTAAQDVRLLGNVFTGLLQDLPPLIEKLQPLSTGILKVAGSLTQMIGNLEKGNTGLESFIKYTTKVGTTGIPQVTHSSGILGDALHAVVDAGKAGSTALRDWALGSGKAATSVQHFGAEAAPAAVHVGRLSSASSDLSHNMAAGAAALDRARDADHKFTGVITGSTTPALWSLNTAVQAVHTSIQKLSGGLLTNQQDQITWQQSLQAANQQLQSNSAGLSGNSKNALANKQAVLNSTQAALALADQEGKTKGGIDKASGTIQAQIRWLQGLHDKSKFVRDEIHALRREEEKLKNIQQHIAVTGSGRWNVVQSNLRGAQPGKSFGGAQANMAAGGFISAGTGPRADDVHILASRGEYVTNAAAVSRYGRSFFDAVNAQRLASGGAVGSFSGSIPGLTKWVGSEMNSTLAAISTSVAQAVRAGIAGMATAFGAVPGGGAPAANAALARRMMPAWGSGAEWNAWNAVAMAESGWSQFARNPSSGAYGIPQALPGSKMGAAANPPQSNPGAQIAWMIQYIRTRYGDPVGAWGHEQAFHWYGSGFHGTVSKPTLFGAGERGSERVDITPAGSTNRPGLVTLTQNGNVYLREPADAATVAARISFAVTSSGLG